MLKMECVCLQHLLEMLFNKLKAQSEAIASLGRQHQQPPPDDSNVKGRLGLLEERFNEVRTPTSWGLGRLVALAHEHA
jgi:hypothetical protein